MWGKKFLVACGLVAATSGVVSCNESKENKDGTQKENTEDVVRTIGMEEAEHGSAKLVLKGDNLKIYEHGFSYVNHEENIEVKGFSREDNLSVRIQRMDGTPLWVGTKAKKLIADCSISAGKVSLDLEDAGVLKKYMPAECQEAERTPVKQTGSRTASFSRGER